MHRIKVAFDAQLLFEQQKTGIGWNAKKLIDCLIQRPELECTLNCFLIKDKSRAEKILREYRDSGCIINQSRWMPARIYYHLERIVPFPYRWIFGKKAEVTQFFNYTIPAGTAGKKLTIIHDVAFLAHPETVTKRTYRWLSRNIRSYCSRAEEILTVSEFSRQEIHRYLGIPLEKIQVVYNGVDTEQYHPDYSEEQIRASMAKYHVNGHYILYMGTLEPRKNIETLIKAYGILKETYAENIPKLVLAGKKGWLYDSIFQMVQDLGLEKQVIFTGYVEAEDAAPLFCGAEMFVFPSLYEGFGIPPLEAMACGTPVITSDCSSLPEVAGSAGLMVPPMDAAALADKMELLITDHKLRARLKQAGIERAKQFTWEASAEKLVQIYKKVGG